MSIVELNDVVSVRGELSLAQRRVIIEALAWSNPRPIHSMKADTIGSYGAVRVIDALQEFIEHATLGETATHHARTALDKIERAYIAHREKESKQ